MRSCVRLRAAPLLVALAVVALLLPATARADPIRIDFSLPNGTSLTNQYQGLGVVFTGYQAGTTWDIGVGVWPSPYYGEDPTGTIALNSYCSGNGYIRADFSVPVNFVSMDYRLFEGTSGPLSLQLYDGAGVLLTSNVITGLRGEWYTLTATTGTANVAYAIFAGEDEYHINAVQNDNLEFGTVADPASTLLLFGAALASLSAARRTWQR